MLLLYFFSLYFTPAFFRSVLPVLFSTNSPRSFLLFTFYSFCFYFCFGISICWLNCAFVVVDFIFLLPAIAVLLLLFPPLAHSITRVFNFFCFVLLHFLLACLPPFNPSIRPRYNCVISLLFDFYSYFCFFLLTHAYIHTHTVVSEFDFICFFFVFFF